MADLVPAGASPPPARSVLAPLTDPAGGPALVRLGAFARQDLVRSALPWFAGIAVLGAAALAWAALSPAPQRVLYSELDDGERAAVVETLEKAGITYAIDQTSGTLTVGEDDLYQARMLVASDGSLARPDTGAQMLDSMPLGASRTLEGERLRAARERELMLTIQQIDGVESVRVHLAQAEKSVFVRDNIAPSASVMLRLARGRTLSESQVMAVVNLVAGSVPGLTADKVRVVDQHGRLISDARAKDSDRLEIQARMEDKLRMQVAGLLTPVLGEGNFTSEIQVDLDMDEVTSARESYDKEGGVVRSETQAQSTLPGQPQAIGVPGALTNTPPPPPVAQPGAPQGTPAAAGGGAPAGGEASSTRTYELNREVAVSNQGPGRIRRVSVAVAISGAAMKGAKAADIEQVKSLVSAAVGADPQRGDQVAVIVRKFEAVEEEGLPFWEAPWFAMAVRNAVALIAVLMVLLLGVRPLVRALKRDPAPAATAPGEAGAAGAAQEAIAFEPVTPDPETGKVDPEALSRQVGMAQRLVAEKPDAAVHALRQMLGSEQPAGAA